MITLHDAVRFRRTGSCREIPFTTSSRGWATSFEKKQSDATRPARVGTPFPVLSEKSVDQSRKHPQALVRPAPTSPTCWGQRQGARAASICESAKLIRRRTNSSATVFASGNGSYPRNRMIAGMYRISGLDRFPSHLKTLVLSTPSCSATSFWSFSPSRRFRM
jgi:hypothetical protein